MNDNTLKSSDNHKPLPFISVVMPAHNEERYISDCLQALKSQDYPADRFEIIVVDNNSTDRTSEIAKSFGATVLFKEKGPVGAVRNYGAKTASGDIIAFIDSDCVAPVDWLSTGENLLATNTRHVFGGGYSLREHPYWIEKYWLLQGKEGPQLPKDLLGGSIMIHKSALEEVGMFDECITSGEDSKLAEHLRESGYKVTTVAPLNVAHLGNPTNGTAFFTRQIWHSENYLIDITSSLRDPTFYIILLFVVLLILIPLASIWDARYAFGLTLLATFIPMLFSAKRILRSKFRIQSPLELLCIYWLDFLYVTARCVGLWRSAKKKIIDNHTPLKNNNLN